ncbi:hypothetical protein [Maritimibacter sp. DP1N21-5]|uniref:hypothetical protein n=1 Tax=Maritimibacter sp. DP1N21-5 TaxID=2836867 RepID=UPI001C43774A|nr:hypothetical protein [Maritimibacter sp. DP1N21-5]MBV7408295.1 hypothetical protein [Maritimibacter sp. DP1N21-5]
MYYDFDIHRHPDGDADYVALFRDPKVIAALQGSSDMVRVFFEAAGFGMEQGQSGIPAGYFDPADEDHIAEVTERLARAFAAFDLKGEDFNGFNLADFAEALAAAEPLPDEEAPKDADVAMPEAPPVQSWSRAIASAAVQVAVVIALFAIGKGAWTALG